MSERLDATDMWLQYGRELDGQRPWALTQGYRVGPNVLPADVFTRLTQFPSYAPVFRATWRCSASCALLPSISMTLIWEASDPPTSTIKPTTQAHVSSNAAS